MANTKITYEDFCKIIGYKFTQYSLFEKALTHSSFTQTKLENNERLEFLGDRVLGLSVAKMLYNTYTKDDEGALAVRHAKLVSANTCAEVAEQIGIPDIIEVSKQEQRRHGNQNKNILADCMEAILGAIFLDSDFDTAFKVIEKFWKDKILQSKTPTKDFKTQLQEYTQKKFNTNPEYILVSTTGPAHAPMFEIKSTVEDITVTAKGASKKEAEQNVAKEILKEIKKK